MCATSLRPHDNLREGLTYMDEAPHQAHTQLMGPEPACDPTRLDPRALVLNLCSVAAVPRQMLRGGLGPADEGTWHLDSPCRQRGTTRGSLSSKTVFYKGISGRLQEEAGDREAGWGDRTCR